MKIGLIANIHSNSIALEAVLEDMPKVDQLICLGDIVGFGPHPAKSVEIVRQEADIVLLGNHETYLSSPRTCLRNKTVHEGIKHSIGQLSNEQLQWARSLPYRSYENRVFAAHGHPDPKKPFKRVRKSNITNLIPFSHNTTVTISQLATQIHNSKNDSRKCMQKPEQ